MRTLRADRHMLSVEWVTVQVRESHSMEGGGPGPALLLSCEVDEMYLEGSARAMGVCVDILGLRPPAMAMMVLMVQVMTSRCLDRRRGLAAKYTQVVVLFNLLFFSSLRSFLRLTSSLFSPFC